MYYHVEFPNVRCAKFRNQLQVLKSLEQERSSIFNEAKLRQTMICGVQIDEDSDYSKQMNKAKLIEANLSQELAKVQIKEISDLHSIPEVPQEDMQSLIINTKHAKGSDTGTLQIDSSSTTKANESSSKPNDGNI